MLLGFGSFPCGLERRSQIRQGLAGLQPPAFNIFGVILEFLFSILAFFDQTIVNGFFDFQGGITQEAFGCDRSSNLRLEQLQPGARLRIRRNQSRKDENRTPGQRQAEQLKTQTS